uniref:Transmembrane protein n=1 Tax=Trichuris muris TaxID=70415 RepID=A0A5S6QZU7_TRIMR
MDRSSLGEVRPGEAKPSRFLLRLPFFTVTGHFLVFPFWHLVRRKAYCKKVSVPPLRCFHHSAKLVVVRRNPRRFATVLQSGLLLRRVF